MTKLKLALRVAIKIVLTPLVLLTAGFVIGVFHAFWFYEWLGDRDDWISREIASEWKNHLKQWFTTL